MRFLALSVAALAIAAPANAITILNNQATLTSADINKSFTVTTDGSTANSTGLYGKLVFTLTGVTNVGSGTQYSFNYNIANASVTPAPNSRLGQFGFDVSGTPGSGLTVSDGASDYFQLTGNGNFNGLGGRDVCLTAGNNCSGGGNAGILSGAGNSKVGTLIFTYANAAQSITFGNFATRWQAGQNNASASGGGIVALGVPEPATWAMMIGGFGLLGAVVRRRKAVATFA